MNELELSALDGANPLGFLAALGTLAVLSETDSHIRLGWKAKARWTPFLTSTKPFDETEILQRLAERLHGQPVDAKAERKREASQERLDTAKRRLKDAKDALKALKLRGNQLKAERDRLVEPVRQRFDKRRKIVLARRKVAVPSPELSIGKKIDLSADEFRSNAKSFLQDVELGSFAIAMLAGLASESCDEKQCPRTRFDFIDSSGQLAFLEAALQLMSKATPERLEATLFRPWKRTDEKYSLRFDPVEDRRYALLDRDPTAGNNKSTSEWMANLLAYRALCLFPCVITCTGSTTAGWNSALDEPCFTWPIWQAPLPPDTIRSLLGHAALVTRDIPSTLRHLGIAAAYRSRRIENGDYVNFSPAQGVF
jgi:hypothetical protein